LFSRSTQLGRRCGFNGRGGQFRPTSEAPGPARTCSSSEKNHSPERANPKERKDWRSLETKKKDPWGEKHLKVPRRALSQFHSGKANFSEKEGGGFTLQKKKKEKTSEQPLEGRGGRGVQKKKRFHRGTFPSKGLALLLREPFSPRQRRRKDS